LAPFAHGHAVKGVRSPDACPAGRVTAVLFALATPQRGAVYNAAITELRKIATDARPDPASAHQRVRGSHGSAFISLEQQTRIGIMSTTSEHWRFVDVSGPAYKEPLTPTVKRALLALVICLHVGGGWALTRVEPVKLVVGDIAPMQVRMYRPSSRPSPIRRSTSRHRCRS
jgi:hypothetical protein